MLHALETSLYALLSEKQRALGRGGVRGPGPPAEAHTRAENGKVIKPVGMNITRRPPQGLERQGRTRGYSYQRPRIEI